jgi:hypothetical protein
MVVDADRVRVGVITQTDLLTVLYRAYVVEAVVASQAAQAPFAAARAWRSSSSRISGGGMVPRRM